MALRLEQKLLLATTLILGLWASEALSRALSDEVSITDKHDQWMARYRRVYQSDAEKAVRFQIFKTNLDFIEAFNAGGTLPYKLGLNEFADMSNDEFRATHNGYKTSPPSRKLKGTSFRYENVTATRSTVDWRKKGAVTPIRNQGQCAVEGIHKLKTGKLVSLSEQELVDCDIIQDQGCNGGLMDNAFGFIVSQKGLTTETNYPYIGSDETCNSKKAASDAATITGYEDVPANSESALLKAVANQPISVAIDASGSAFQFYKSGVFTGECGTGLDHGVTAVGYGTSEDGKEYWLVKNT